MAVKEPHTRRWSREEYHEMARMGWFEGQRVELIDGEIIETAPQRNEHYVALNLVVAALEEAFGKGYWVRSQGPLRMPNGSEPEPDIAVVKGTVRDYKNHPTSALLIVEVSDSRFEFDVGRKASIYAEAGIPDYWVLNLEQRTLHVHRTPTPDPPRELGCRYAHVVAMNESQSASPIALPNHFIKVADLLP